MNFSREEIKIMANILKVNDSKKDSPSESFKKIFFKFLKPKSYYDVIAFKNFFKKSNRNYDDIIPINELFFKIIKLSKGKVNCIYIKEKKQYIFYGKNYLEYLRIISYTFEKLINNNLLKVFSKNEENLSILFLKNNSQEIDDPIILKMKDKLNSCVYVTQEMIDLSKWNAMKGTICIIVLILLIIAFYLLFILLRDFTKEYFKTVYISYTIYLLFCGIILSLFIKNGKEIFSNLKYPFLNMEAFNTTLTFYSVLIAVIALFIA